MFDFAFRISLHIPMWNLYDIAVSMQNPMWPVQSGQQKPPFLGFCIADGMLQLRAVSRTVRKFPLGVKS
jgi:hypothetical protein